ncbi:MAG: aminotransferase class V-fold PLP-dependent enzyme [Elusimicrobiota bacterium]
MTFDPQKFRQDFPILKRTFSGKPLIYLDSAATTQKPNSVIDELSRFYRESNANIHRGVYALAEEATQLYEDARKNVSKFIGSLTSENVIFTRNTTESINLVAYSWARKFLKEGDEILISDMEHHANFVPWYILAKEKNIKLKTVSLNDDFTLNLELFQKLLTPQVKLVAVTSVSNVLGTINPIDKIIKLAHANGSKVLIDGAQSVPHLPTNITEMNADFFAFSAHKMLGPTGVGVLWVRPEILEQMDPFLGGGEMINAVSIEKTTWADLPYKFEAGTPNFADVAAFSKSIEYLNKVGMNAIREHEKELLQYAINKLSQFPDLQLYGTLNPETQSGALSFNHKVVHAHDVGTILGEEGIAIRVGHHCAQPLMKALKISSTARASFYLYNTKEEIDALVKGLEKVNKVFGLTGASAR